MVYFRHLFKTKEGLAAVGYSCGSFYQKTRFVDVKSLFSEIPQFMSDPKPESQSWQDFDKEINSTIEDLKNCHDQRT
jgi:hypothetical protein